MLINEQTTTLIVTNPIASLPSISTTDLINLMRVDKTLGNERLANAIANAYVVVNSQVFPLKANLCDDWQNLYKQAVLHEATALLCELHADFDTIGQGLARNDVAKQDSLRRLVQHFIADMTGKPRNRITLL